MTRFEKIRQCCGMQMSKYEILRLNGCEMSKYIERSDYPKCEMYNLSKIENEFEGMPIPYTENNSDLHWTKSGDCARFVSEISSGKGFNGNPFEGCFIKGRFAGYTPLVKPESDISEVKIKARVDISKGIPKSNPFHSKMSFDPLVNNYIKFHNLAINDGRLKDGARYLVYTCSDKSRCGGVGDRVLGMVKAFYFAMATGRVLLIDAHFPIELKKTLNPSFIKWDANFPATKFIFDDMKLGVPMKHREDVVGYFLDRCNGVKRWKLINILESKYMEALLNQNNHSSKIKLSVSRAIHQAFWALFKFDETVLSRAEEMKLNAGLALSRPNRLDVTPMPPLPRHLDKNNKWSNRTDHVNDSNKKSLKTHKSRTRRSLKLESTNVVIQESGMKDMVSYIGLHIRQGDYT
eukprot:CAMPEP_0194293814 /NCGR_PEP_ID=MMETSP0169-20130528/48728_1 /TAXON_ID=218684 /ORGANISM="Corethron pennatum, Strain L29A3" /LENGTH=405 /DNA_ID=CAMNT_0039042465 /DNA_START=89 /DNA_END=1302 /DNA_ORIENTATION=+